MLPPLRAKVPRCPLRVVWEARRRVYHPGDELEPVGRDGASQHTSACGAVRLRLVVAL